MEHTKNEIVMQLLRGLLHVVDGEAPEQRHGMMMIREAVAKLDVLVEEYSTVWLAGEADAAMRDL